MKSASSDRTAIPSTCYSPGRSKHWRGRCRADVRLDHPVDFRVGDQRDKTVDVFQKGIPSEFRRTHKVGLVQLVLVQLVVLKHLKHVGQQADVASKVDFI